MDYEDQMMMTVRLTLEEYERSIEIKASSIQGKGLFTKVDLAAQTILRKIEGKLRTHPYHASRSEANPNWMGIGYEKWIELDAKDRTVFINHSCEPNVIINQDLELITLKAIEKDEEILLDYSTTELDPSWKMTCNCKSEECRSTIKSYQFLPYNLQQKYAKFLAPVFNVYVSAPLA